MFFHANTPKWNPATVLSHSDAEFDLTWGSRKDKEYPAFTHPEMVVDDYNVKDIESQLWEECRWIACELQGRLKGLDSTKCQELDEYVRTVLKPRLKGEGPSREEGGILPRPRGEIRERP